jgi:hypothetical protein
MNEFQKLGELEMNVIRVHIQKANSFNLVSLYFFLAKFSALEFYYFLKVAK